MALDGKLLIRIVLSLAIIAGLVWWLRESVTTIKFDGPYVHEKCCASHGGCEDKEKCAAGTASCCSNEECGTCCGSSRDGIPVCRTKKVTASADSSATPPVSATYAAKTEQAQVDAPDDATKNGRPITD